MLQTLKDFDANNKNITAPMIQRLQVILNRGFEIAAKQIELTLNEEVEEVGVPVPDYNININFLFPERLGRTGIGGQGTAEYKINDVMRYYLDVKIEEPDVYPLAIQGPKSEDLMVSIFGEEIRKIKFFNFRVLDFEGTKQIVARSGYSKQDGFEIYFKVHENYFDKIELGEKLWDTIWQAGKVFNISPGCPNLIDRIECGLMSYGNDFTLENNPFECNLDKYCPSDASHEYIGKTALSKIQNEGIKQRMRGIIFDGDPCPATSQPLKVLSKDNKKIGQITSGIFSPRIKKNIGLSMILKDHWEIGEKVIIETLDGDKRNGTITSLPFPD